MTESRNVHGWQNKGRVRRHAKRNKHRRLRFEGLEERRVLAVFHLTSEVNDGLAGSLRNAITIANSNQEDDQIHLAEGIYNLTLAGAADDDNANGDLDFTEAGRSVTIMGVGVDGSIIDAAQLSDRVFDILAGVTATLQGVTIQHGSHVVHGGGIRNAGTLNIRDTAVSENSSDLGGGLYNAGGELVIDNGLFRENVASDGGGILNFDGQLTIRDSEIRDNAATGSRGQISTKPWIVAGNGGGLLNVSATATITSSMVVGNSAFRFGGGIGTAGGTMELSESTIAENSAKFGGGASTLFVVNGEAEATTHFRWPWEAGTLEVRQSTFTENHATLQGGGLLTTGFSKVEIFKSTFARNQSGLPGGQHTGIGGALYLHGSGSEVSILHSTITENAAQLGAGILHNAHKLQLGSSIVASNYALDSGIPQDFSSSRSDANVLSLGNNLIGNTGPSITGLVNGVLEDVVGGNGSLPINPLLEPQQDDRGPTGTFAPTQCSPAIAIGAGAIEVVSEDFSSSINCNGSAQADWYTLAAGDFVLPITANDVSTENSARTIAWIGEPSHGGKLSISADQTSVHYSPADSFQGTETFPYAIQGSDGDLEHAIVTVRVVAGPMAEHDERIIRRDSGETALDVLANDIWIEALIGVPPIVEVTTSAAGGVTEIAADGRSIRYNAPAGFVGEDKFEYTLVGGRRAPVRLRVYDPNSVLRAADHRYTVVSTPDTAGSICNPDEPDCPLINIVDGWHFPVLDNRTRGAIAIDLLTIESVSEPDQGGYVGIIQRTTGEQWIQYRPSPGFTGVETFTYVTRDLEGRTSTGTVTVDVIELMDEMARIRLEVTDAAGNPLESIQPGEQFQLRVMAQDLRPANDQALNELSVLRSGYWWSPGTLRAVQRAAVRVGFDSTLVSVAGDVQFGAPYADSGLNSHDPVVKLSTDHVDLSAYADWYREIGNQDVVFASIPLIAKSSGAVTFTIAPTYGVDVATFDNIPNDAVDYKGTTLNVHGRWQNPRLREDVNHDALTTPMDALVIINDLNEKGVRQLSAGEGEESRSAESISADAVPTSYYLDVNGDGWLTSNDALIVINRLNQNSSTIEAEGEASSTLVGGTLVEPQFLSVEQSNRPLRGDNEFQPSRSPASAVGNIPLSRFQSIESTKVLSRYGADADVEDNWTGAREYELLTLIAEDSLTARVDPLTRDDLSRTRQHSSD